MSNVPTKTNISYVIKSRPKLNKKNLHVHHASGYIIRSTSIIHFSNANTNAKKDSEFKNAKSVFVNIRHFLEALFTPWFQVSSEMAILTDILF